MANFVHDSVDILHMFDVVGYMDSPQQLKRFFSSSVYPHRILEVPYKHYVGGKQYCGDFLCHGDCGLSKLIRLYYAPSDALQKSVPYENPVVIEAASALLGMEPVWSTRRWQQSAWRGSVVICKYDGQYPMWL